MDSAGPSENPDVDKTPPCGLCDGCCCKQSGHRKYAVGITEEEAGDFPEAVPITEPWGESLALPYVDGRCIHLTDDDLCGIYDRRPKLCREFTCMDSYYAKGTRHSFFLEDNPPVVVLIETSRPEYAQQRRDEWRARARAWRMDDEDGS